MLHVHIGPSPLALGLLIPMTTMARFDVCLVGRPGQTNETSYGISGIGMDDELNYIPLPWFPGPAQVNELPDDLLKRVGSEPLLLTMSLREAIAVRHEFVEALLDLRAPETETVVIACENAPHEHYGHVRAACTRTGALFLRTVINRMCLDLGTDKEGRRNVSVHRLAEWLVERPPAEQHSAVLAALAAIEGFALVDDIEARHHRKLWMVNGGHQALALMGRKANADHRVRDLAIEAADALEARGKDGVLEDLRESARTPVVVAAVGQLQSAMSEALLILHPDLDQNLAYGLKHVIAYSEHRDGVERVLAKFTRINLAPFLEDLNDRIGAPARICFEHERSVEAFAHVINVLLELVANIDAFEDNDDVRRGGLAGAADPEAVESFRRLVTPWTADAIEASTAHFAQILAEHRAAFAG